VGRPRDRQIDTAVLEATLAVLDESGYGGLTLEEVARHAGTSKPAIYRRWPSRQRLVLAALGQRLGPARAPDTGCTLCDLDECLKVFVAAFRRMPPGVLGPLFADCAGDRELRTAFMTTLFDPPRAAVRETLERAHARGEHRDRTRGRSAAPGHRHRLSETARAQSSRERRSQVASSPRLTVDVFGCRTALSSIPAEPRPRRHGQPAGTRGL
jgi:AcrR family transcriptional regulator